MPNLHLRAGGWAADNHRGEEFRVKCLSDLDVELCSEAIEYPGEERSGGRRIHHVGDIGVRKPNGVKLVDVMPVN